VHNVTVSLEADSYYVLYVASQGFTLPSVMVNGTSETITFTVTVEPEPFTTVPVLAASIVVAIVVVASIALVYFKRRGKPPFFLFYKLSGC
jgi:cobalamin biosynthesis Mg chelatase CobN